MIDKMPPGSTMGNPPCSKASDQHSHSFTKKPTEVYKDTAAAVVSLGFPSCLGRARDSLPPRPRGQHPPGMGGGRGEGRNSKSDIAGKTWLPRRQFQGRGS